MHPTKVPLLKLSRVHCEFTLRGGFANKKRVIQAVRGIDLQLRRGEVLGLVGESGCGKSTLGRIALGLQRPAMGMVELNGRDIRSFSRLELARTVQPIFQDPYSSLNPKWRVRDILVHPLRLHRIGAPSEREGIAEALLQQCGLPSRFLNAFPSQLSGGQRQRVAIARALVLQPELIICDEPTSALDVSVQAQILNLLQDLREKLGLTFLFISHNLSVVEYMSSRVSVMYAGRIVEEAPAATLFHHARHPYTEVLLNSVLTTDPALGLPIFHEPPVGSEAVPTNNGCAFYMRCGLRFPHCAHTAPPFRGEQQHRWECHSNA